VSKVNSDHVPMLKFNFFSILKYLPEAASVAIRPGGGESGTTKVKNDVINVFTVASGLLYEVSHWRRYRILPDLISRRKRMAFIMMISVVRHTESAVKFWIIENFVSPSFKVSYWLFKFVKIADDGSRVSYLIWRVNMDSSTNL
jgi:hypothetical protein